LLHDELIDRLAGRVPPPPAMTCREVAAQQRSDRWAPRRASATAYWREVLTSAAPLLVDPCDAVPGPRTTWLVRLTSAGLTRDGRGGAGNRRGRPRPDDGHLDPGRRLPALLRGRGGQRRRLRPAAGQRRRRR